MYIIKQIDLDLLKQHTKNFKVECQLLDKNQNFITDIAGNVISGSYSIDADSDVRRTVSLSIALENMDEFKEVEYFTYYIKIFMCIYSLRTKEFVKYNLGVYSFDTKSRSYSATEDTLNINLIDKMGLLDSDHRGVVYGASTTIIKALDDDGTRPRAANGVSTITINNESGSVVNTLANALIYVLQQANISDYVIDEIGAYSCVTADDTAVWFDSDNNLDFTPDDGIYHPYLNYNEDGTPDTTKALTVKQHTALEFYRNSGSVTDIKSKEVVYDDDGNPTDETTTIINSVDSRYEYYEIPYDLEFELGSSYLDEINEIRDMYSNYETYFDINGTFRCNMIPTLYSDAVLLDETIMNEYVINESYNTNIYDVKNVIELWGKENDVDNYSDVPVYLRHNADGTIDNDIYVAILPYGYESMATIDGVDTYYYEDGMVLGLQFSTNVSSGIKKLMIKTPADENTVITQDTDGIVDDETFISYPIGKIYDPYNGSYTLDSGTFEANKVYLFQWNSSLDSGNGAWYYIGGYQTHAVAVLTDGSVTKEYIANKFNCQPSAVYLDVEENSPYTIEKIGYVPKVVNGEDYENIVSDGLAMDCARYELWKSARRQETLSLEMVMIPFLDVNNKVSYIRQEATEVEQFIVKKISGDFDSGTMSVEMMKFYPLYEDSQ